MNNAVLGKTMANVRQHRNIKLVTTERRRNYVVSQPNYDTAKFFKENSLAIEMRKSQILMNKLAYLDLSILDLSKTVMYEFWYNYVKPKYGENLKLGYMKTDIDKDTAYDNETRFENSNFELDRPLSKRKNKKIIGLMKDELGRQIMKEFVGLRVKAYIYVKDNNDEDKKAKGIKKCVIKRKLKVEDYKNY